MSRTLWGAIVAAVGLRLLRMVVRWDEVAWQYASYPAATVDALERGELGAALTGFTGLHPPLWPLLHSLTELWMPVPWLWMGGSVLCSVGAVVLVGRRSPLAALVLATAPAQVHYAAEVNQYPLLMLVIAGVWTTREDAEAGRPGWFWVWCGLAAWTHALGGVTALLAIGSLTGRRRWGALSVLGLVVLPLVPGVWALLVDSGSYRQPPWRGALVLSDLVGRFGGLALLWVPWIGWGTRQRKAEAQGVVGLAAVLLLMVGLGVAAPHQFPYLVAFGVPVALLISAGASRWRAAAIGLAVVQGVWQGSFDVWRVWDLAHDAHPRAIDVALTEADEVWTCSGTPARDCSGDAVVLLAPPGPNDDDKTRSSAVLWRISPWRALPRVRPYLVDGAPLDHGDHRHGQPRLVDGRVVVVHDWPRPTLERVVDAHKRVWVVVYEQGQRTEYTSALAERLGVQPVSIGSDLLFRVGEP